MNVRLTWTDCDEVGDFIAPYVLNAKDLVSRLDNMGETVLHTQKVIMRIEQPIKCFVALQKLRMRLGL